MSIRKITDLPFAELDDANLSASVIEISYPEDLDLGNFASKGMMMSDFKTFVIKELSDNNEFPNGIYISSFTDIVGTLSVNCRDAGQNSTNVYIKGQPLVIEGKPITLSSNDVRIYSNGGSIGGYMDKLDEVGLIKTDPSIRSGTGNALISVPTTTTTKFSIAPTISQPVDQISSNGANAATVGVLTRMLDEIRQDFENRMKTFGTMASCDYEVALSASTGVPIRDSFYFIINNYTING